MEHELMISEGCPNYHDAATEPVKAVRFSVADGLVAELGPRVLGEIGGKIAQVLPPGKWRVVIRPRLYKSEPWFWAESKALRELMPAIGLVFTDRRWVVGVYEGV